MIEVMKVVKRWREAADFMIKKHTAGVRMINAETTYQEASIDAVTLPGDMYTKAITYPDAIATARELTGQGTRWSEAANRFYKLTPQTNEARSGRLN